MTPEEVFNDALTMALRLMGEDEDTFGPECREVMDRWKPICLDALRQAAGPGGRTFEE